MSTVRQYGGFATSDTFGSAINKVLDSNGKVAQHKTIHHVFDNYEDLSIKTSERIRKKAILKQ